MSNSKDNKEVQSSGTPEEKGPSDNTDHTSDNILEHLRQIAGEDAIVTVEESESLGISKEIHTPPTSPKSQTKQFAPGELELFHSKDWPLDPKKKPPTPKDKLN